jgi:hypothetical protein
MSTAETIASYIAHKRGLGMRFATENAILIAFGKSSATSHFATFAPR